MNVDELVATARERAGLDDLGVATWREGLEILVHSLNTEAALNELGVYAMSEQIIGYLVTRLRVEGCYAEHPDIEEQQIIAPLFGLGLPRTGSTALSYLMAQDPARRSLRVWEAGEPCPPPETATELTDPRIALAQATIELTNQMVTGLAEMLPSAADGPQECLVAMASDFRSVIFEGMANIPTYSNWILTCDMEPAYRFHKRVLKLLQWHCPPSRWWLKTPAHMFSIDALNAVYPDARFVMTHREVGKVLPSVSALYNAFGAMMSDHSDPIAIGSHNQSMWRSGLQRLLEFRDAGNEGRFHDLSFEAVQSDPITQVEQLYADLGEEFTVEARERMKTWWAESSKKRSGPGAYPPETYGLDLGVIAKEFAFYHERFDIPVTQSTRTGG